MYFDIKFLEGLNKIPILFFIFNFPFDSYHFGIKANTLERISKMVKKRMEEKFEQLDHELEEIRTCAKTVLMIEETLTALMKTVEKMSIQVGILVEVKKA